MWWEDLSLTDEGVASLILMELGRLSFCYRGVVAGVVGFLVAARPGCFDLIFPYLYLAIRDHMIVVFTQSFSIALSHSRTVGILRRFQKLHIFTKILYFYHGTINGTIEKCSSRAFQ
jgi:hypothetical protein